MTMVMISEARPFWGTDAVAPTSQFAYVRPDGNISEEPVELESLRGKSVMVIFHGYDNTKNVFLPAYFQVKKDLEARVRDGQNKPLYDVVVGYHAPLCDSTLEYYEARSNAAKVATRVRENFLLLGSLARSVDVIAHSMGNRVVLEALKGDVHLGEQAKMVRRLFCFAPAVDDETVQRGDVYASSLKRCSEALIFYSRRDDVLKDLYPLVEWDSALGYAGAENQSRLPRNAQQVDCTAIVDGHSAYLNAMPLYDFIRDKGLGKVPDAKAARVLKILDGGRVVQLKKSGSWLPAAVTAAGVFATFAVWLVKRSLSS